MWRANEPVFFLSLYARVVEGGFANVREDPDERHKNDAAQRSTGPKSLGRGYCGKLIKEGVLYKQGLRSKVWSRRSIQLTSEALVYSHAVRSHGGFIAVSAITNCRGIDIDGEPLGFQVIEDDSRVHVYRCHSQRSYACRRELHCCDNDHKRPRLLMVWHLLHCIVQRSVTLGCLLSRLRAW